MISEDYLDRWTKEGARTNPSEAQKRVKNILFDNNIKFKHNESNIGFFVQGSHKNRTTIHGNSDVDLLVIYDENLPKSYTGETKRDIIDDSSSKSSTDKDYENLRENILYALKKSDYEYKEHPKSIKLIDDRLYDVDIVPCLLRNFVTYKNPITNNYYYETGILLKEKINYLFKSEYRDIYNFPFHHYENGIEKNKNSNGNYKKTIRIFKNFRDYYINNNSTDFYDSLDIERNISVSSYFIECLLYNVPSDIISEPNNLTRVVNILSWLNKQKNFNRFIQQNKLLKLYVDGCEIYNIADEKDLIKQNDAHEFVNIFREDLIN